MRTARIAFALPGLAALVWGLILAVQFALHSFRDGRSAIAFFVGGPILHDALVAPFVGVVGLLISRLVAQPWRTPVRLGAAISGVLTLIAVPAIWRTYAGQPNPGLDDRNYTAGLVIALAVVWVGVAGWGLLRRRRVPKPAPPAKPTTTIPEPATPPAKTPEQPAAKTPEPAVPAAKVPEPATPAAKIPEQPAAIPEPPAAKISEEQESTSSGKPVGRSGSP